MITKAIQQNLDRIGIGTSRERDAEFFLNKQGLKTLTRNYRCRLGEIDLVMTDGNYLVFTEVRFRRPGSYGTGAESISRAKRSKLIRAAAHYLRSNRISAHQACRFDVVSVEEKITGPKMDYHMNWIRAAFQADE